MILSRSVVRFSTDGGRAACRATDHTGAQSLELWQLTPDGPRRTTTVAASGEAGQTQLVVLADGRTLHCGYRPGEQTVTLVHPDGRSTPLDGDSGPLRFLPAPNGSGWLATVLSPLGDGTLVSAVLADGVRREVGRLPGRAGGAGVSGAHLAVTVLMDGVPTVVRLDPATGRCTPLLAAGDPLSGTPAHLLTTGGEHVLLGLSVARPAGAAPAGPEHRLAVVSATGPARLMPGGTRLPGVTRPIAMDPGGRVALLTVVRGVRSELHRIDLSTGVAGTISVPPGVLAPVGGCSPDGWWLPFSAPGQPCRFAWLPPGAAALRTAGEPAGAAGWSGARVERLPGAAGPIEAVVYGPDWRGSPGVVLALHGGPDAHWDLAFDPFFQLMVRAGLTVVAPNQRGSTGYGPAHADAINGAWGDPDVADVLALAHGLRAGRAPHAARPVVYGTSYGAFLALLAAAKEPQAWSGCAAIAPFRSAAALYPEAGPAVRNLIDRLGGLSDRSADLDAVIDRVTVPVLLAHGQFDEAIPVSHSRALAGRLSAAGRSVRYLEAPGRGHSVLRASLADPVTASLLAFLADPVRQDPAALEPAGSWAP
ncbi:hypothetical protein Aph02nite_14900 [Actinoplanes philippinensis]|uniref:Prolyl oligopeptidase family protein n=1 Tax=Actinoplanes philippinensis TaxID=35752 RepID=A0A1I1ZGW5_9ACTN|nr:alpha/beta fold hydrolase [Actinoplanes philippinensis]GIE75540.1 hypothetical protein Aph02nite_14900 [Actinoplanes philippinensis]SFE29803.1 Prolyl oligopeptidase family protein [Actinoplanes philippinensis]